MEFETSVIYSDCIYILRVKKINEQMFEVIPRNVIGEKALTLPPILQLLINESGMECVNFSHPFVSNVIAAIQYHLKRGNSSGPYKRAI